MDNLDKKDNNNSRFDIVFKKSHYFRFLYQKTEKVACAVHLITDLIKDEDAIKWQLRKISIELLSDMLTLHHSNLSDKKHARKVQGSLAQLISLFEIAYTAKIVSEMNLAILRRELAGLLETIEGQLIGESGEQNLVLSEEFFKTSSHEGIDKGHYIGQDKRHTDVMSFTNNPDITAIRRKHASPNKQAQRGQSRNLNHIDKDKKTQDRRIVILQTLKKTKDIGVHDLVDLIKDCSEKTIQRELLGMVRDGVLKKQGERRWSRYILA